MAPLELPFCLPNPESEALAGLAVQVVPMELRASTATLTIDRSSSLRACRTTTICTDSSDQREAAVAPEPLRYLSNHSRFVCISFNTIRGSLGPCGWRGSTIILTGTFWRFNALYSS